MNPAARVALGAGTAWYADRVLSDWPPAATAAWRRVNHRGRTVDLRSGPALAVALACAADLPRAAAAVAALGAAAVGRYDDVAGGRDASVKGLRGHAAALRTGRLTSGVVKLVGLAAVGAASCAVLEGRSAERHDLLVGGAVVAGAANLVNLLDLRPGRALKAGAVAALLLHQPGAAAAVGALLPGDLREQSMLGDAGANALGALLGLALVALHPRRRAPALAVLAGSTAVSEVVSYSRVIEAVPVLRWLDRAGRLP